MTITDCSSGDLFGPSASPSTTTPLIGRDDDVRLLTASLETVRLLTLTGPGGVGKSRLAGALAAAQATIQPVHWVNLAETGGDGSPEAVIAAIRVAAGIQIHDVALLSGGTRLAAAFSDPPAMLVLDNADQAAGSCADVVDSLMRLCPALQILVTSREPLGVEGETAFFVAPLSLLGEHTRPDESDAAVLFLDRARAIDPGFAITDDNRTDVFAICRYLHGLPLGVELAATRAASLGVARVLEAVAASAATPRPRDLAATTEATTGSPATTVGLATAGSPATTAGLATAGSPATTAGPATASGRMPAVPEDALPLDALPLEWCYDLLPDDEAALFRRLAAFPAGFDGSGIVAVALGSDVPLTTRTDAHSARRRWDGLVDHRMVAVTDRAGEPWYRLPSPLRVLAAKHLAASRDYGPAVTAHLAYTARITTTPPTAAGGPPSAVDLDQLEAHLPDIRTGFAAAQRAHAALLRVTTPAPIPGSATADWPEGDDCPPDTDWLADDGGDDDEADAVEGGAVDGGAADGGAVDGDRRTRVALGVRMVGGLVRLCYLRGHYREGQQWLEWAVAAGRGGPPGPLAAALRGAGRLAFLRCDYRLASARLGEALDLSTASNDGRAVIETLMWLGSVARETSDFAAAEALCLRARELAAAAGDEESVLRADNYLAFASWLQLRFDETLERCSASLRAAVRIGDSEAMTWLLMSRGAATLYLGDLDIAETDLLEALARSRRERFAEGMAWSQHLLGVVRLRRGDRLGALALLREALTIHLGLGDRWRVTTVLDDFAALASTAADGRTAARFLGAADALRREIQVTPAPVEEGGRRVAERTARGLLRGKDFDAERAAGEEADVDQLVAALGPVSRASGAGAAVPTSPRVPLFRPATVVATLPTGSLDPDGHPASPIPRPPTPSRPSPPFPSPPTPSPAPSTSALPRIDIRMLGSSTVRADGRLLRGTDFGYAKPRELLLLLAATGPRSKEDIGEALWPECPDGKVRGALHTALRELRRAVRSPSLITFQDGRYLLNPSAPVTIDVAHFEADVAAARSANSPREGLPRLREAVALYRGEFLGGGPRPVWAEPIAARLRERYHDLLMLIGDNLSREGRWASATEIFLHAVHHDPNDVEARRLLASAWAGVGGKSATDTREDWLVEFSESLGSIRVTEPPGWSPLYQEIVRRRRSAGVAT